MASRIVSCPSHLFCVHRAASLSVRTWHSSCLSSVRVAFSALCALSARAAWTFPTSNLARYQSYSCSRAVHSPHARISPSGPPGRVRLPHFSCLARLLFKPARAFLAAVSVSIVSSCCPAVSLAITFPLLLAARNHNEKPPSRSKA